MERDQFLKLLGTGALAVCAGCGMQSCSSSEATVVVPPAPTGIDFTLDLTQSANAALQTPGGSLKTNGIIIARVSATEVVALSQSCTHQGTTVNYISSTQNFVCPNHGSAFSKTGTVQVGPATSPLRAYNAVLTGDSLRVSS